MSETCNFCDGEIILPDDVDSLAVVCPECGNVTGVCANCEVYGVDAVRGCARCPFNIELEVRK